MHEIQRAVAWLILPSENELVRELKEKLKQSPSS